MSKIQQISNKIRDCLNDSTIIKTKIFLKKDKGFWDQLWTCLDTIGDTEIAVNSFKKLSVECFQEAPYIHVYGLLQALYLQQDAVANLKEAIFSKTINWEKEYPSVFLIRTIRNEATGHPTKGYSTKNDRSKAKANKYCVIDRSSLSKEGFSYSIWSSWSSSRVDRHNAEFAELIQKQEDALSKELTELLEQIQMEEIEHKKKFTGESLASLIPDREPYSFNLLSNIAFRPIDHLAWIAYEEFKEKYGEIKKGIELRYGPRSNSLRVPGTKLLIDELDRIFLRIDEFKSRDDDVVIDLGIYSDALINKLKELKTHLIEIDEEFTKR